MNRNVRPKEDRSPDTPPIRQEFVALYTDAFVPTCDPPFGIQSLSGKWHWRDHFLSDRVIEQHLRGEFWVAPKGQPHTQEIVFDLDVHSGDGSDLIDRATSVSSIFPDASPLVFSTPRQGLHLRYQLTRTTWTRTAIGFAKDAVAQAGLELRPGHIELYPTGGVLRAPLGADCLMVDPLYWEPFEGSRSDCLGFLHRILKDEKVDRLDIPRNYRPRTPDRLVSKSGRASDADRKRAKGLLERGLEESGIRNESFLVLNRCFLADGKAEEERIALLREWIDTKHNGLSEDYNADREKVYKHIERLVRAQLKLPSGRRKDRPGGVSPQREERIEEYVAGLNLNAGERKLLRRIIAYAFGRSVQISKSYYQIKPPSVVLKSFHWKYKPHLDGLEERLHIKHARNYGADIHRPNTYWLRVPATLFTVISPQVS